MISRYVYTLAFTLGGLLAVSAQTRAQTGAISGRVVDAESGAPLADVRVQARAATGAAGGSA